MADKHKNINNLKKLSVLLFVLFLISGAIFVTSLRSNYSRMVALRNEVYTADKNNTDVSAALNSLRSYVVSHMNTDLSSGVSVSPPIQLQYTYERLLATQANAQSGNSKIYTDAENYCQTQVPNGFSGRYRIPCVENYISTHSLTKINIDPSLYEFDFVSPSWSADRAGIAMLTTILFGVGCLVSLSLILIKKKS